MSSVLLSIALCLASQAGSDLTGKQLILAFLIGSDFRLRCCILRGTEPLAARSKFRVSVVPGDVLKGNYSGVYNLCRCYDLCRTGSGLLFEILLSHDHSEAFQWARLRVKSSDFLRYTLKCVYTHSNFRIDSHVIYDGVKRFGLTLGLFDRDFHDIYLMH